MEYLLTAIIFVLIGERYLYSQSQHKERTKLINSLLVKNEIPIVAEPTDEDEQEKEEEDLTPIEDVLDEKFMEVIHGK